MGMTNRVIQILHRTEICFIANYNHIFNIAFVVLFAIGFVLVSIKLLGTIIGNNDFYLRVCLLKN